MKIKLALAAFFLLQLSCASTKHIKPGQVQKRFANFGVEPPAGYVEKAFSGADLYFENKKKNASIFIEAQCEKFSDSPNEALTAQLLVGLSDIKFISQEREMIAEREALISEIEAKLDGVKRFLKIMVLRKNRCVFDAVLSLPKDDLEAKAEFDRLIHTFWAEAEL